MTNYFGVTIEATPYTDTGQVTSRIDVAARRALEEAVRSVILPKIIERAPGSIGAQVRVGRVHLIGDGVYSIEIKMPRKYAAVEQGSGVFGESGVPYLVQP